ncbi:MAG: hypothetical protein Q8Q56_04925 [Alphaproteobacteria bacterium]|nr:hypothetical protein [Alphaproteobacteria bacterium]
MKKVLLTATLLLSTTSYINAETVASGSGQEFDVISVSGDGNCAFTAIGKSRDEVVAALQSAVQDNEDAYKGFNASRSSLHDAVAALSVATSVDAVNGVLDQVASFISSSSGSYMSDPDYQSPSKLAEAALAEFRLGLGSFSEEDFVLARKLLQSRIENMDYERYEAFQVALKEELKESGMSVSNLSTKAGLSQSIADVFAHNNGRSSWLPMGLIFGVQERLGLNLAVWSSRDEPAGKVKLYQFSAPSDNVWDPSVVHVRWSGGHFDRLSPKQ